MPDLDTLLLCLLIVVGRIADVTLGTIRTIMVVRGRRRWACLLGFFEVLIWIFVIGRVVQGLGENPLYAFSYALGFAAGNFVGITLDNRLALGKQVIQFFSRSGGQLAAELRARGVRLTSFEGQGRDGPTSMLMVIVDRGSVPELLAQAGRIDPHCYWSVEDVRRSGAAAGHMATGWRAFLKKK
jgi:uncharacterized protein YebE (UPF0316 family)